MNGHATPAEGGEIQNKSGDLLQQASPDLASPFIADAHVGTGMRSGEAQAA